MKRRTLATLGLILMWSAAFAAAPAVKPWTPAAGRPAAPADSQPAGPERKRTRYIDGIRDSGQFLPDTSILGSVDDRQFSVWEFREYWFASYAQDRPAADSAGRFQFLTSMADKEVLARLARRVNQPFDFADRAVLREHTQRVLSNMTFQRLVTDSARPDEAELRRAYQQNLQLRHFQHILTTEHAVAVQARAELVAGRITWPQAVARYSVAPQDSGADGDLGWLQRSALAPEQAFALCDLKDGQLSEVFADRDGFQLMRLLGRRPNPLPSYEFMRTFMNEQVTPMKVNQRLEQVRGPLRERIGLAYDSTNISWVSSQFAKTAALKRRPADPSSMDLTSTVPRFTVADTGRVLARWKDGQLSLSGFLAAYKAIPAIQRPEVQTFKSLRWFLDGRILDPFMAQLGTERGIDREPMTIAMIEKKREEIMVGHLFQDSVEAKVWLTPTDRQKYYQSRLPDFWSYQGVRYASIARATQGAADSLADRIRGGEQVVAIMRADSLRLGRRTGSIRFERENQPGPFFTLLSQDMRPGDVTVQGPVKNGDYVVLQKLEHDPGRQLRYEEVEKIVDESLQNITAERLLKEFIARHRAEHKIVLHPELVMRVKLTDPRND